MFQNYFNINEIIDNELKYNKLYIFTHKSYKNVLLYSITNLYKIIETV